MCGICGRWSPDGVSPDLLRRMADQIRHRGPDDDGYYLAGPVGLANRRLSIIGLETGKQPIANEDRTVWVVFNGEIYNYPALRRELTGRGHRFATDSDTEVIVHLYEEAGIDCVRQLRGMFAFALWDERRQRLLLARDPLGQKPLYYALGGGAFTFASEVKALLEDPAIAPRLNARALHYNISVRSIPGTETLFEGIHKLPAGHTMTLERGIPVIRPYWDLRYGPKQTGSEEEIAARLRDVLLETVHCHLLSDVPLGAFLSGGLDSTLVAAMMATLSDRPIKTFSVGVREQDFSELAFARLVAERYRTDHHEYVVEPDLIATLPAMLWHMEEPVDPFAFGVYAVARLARQHVKVALGGDGGDEMFAGYDRYLGNQIVDLYRLVPPALRRHVIAPLVLRLRDDYSYNNRVQRLRWLVAMSDTSAGERYAQSAGFLRFHDAHKRQVYTDALWRAIGDADPAEYLLAYFDADNASDAVDKMLYTDVRTRLADHSLIVVDRMTMAHSLEGRSPLVDQRLAEFAATIPAEMKLKGRRLKHIQRLVAREYLPEPLLRRRKQGFGFPLAYWFAGDLRPMARALFRDSRLAEEGYFRSEGMLAMLDEHAAGRVDHNYRLWLLVNLEIWHRMFIERQSAEALSAELQALLPGARAGASAVGGGPGRAAREVAVEGAGAALSD